MAHLLDPPIGLTESNPVRDALLQESVRDKLLQAAHYHLNGSSHGMRRSERNRLAEEMVSDAQDIALRKAAEFDTASGASVTSWIQGIIRNLARKSGTRTRKHAGADVLDGVADPAASVQHRLIRDADGEEVRKALDKLDPFDRELARLRYFEDLSGSEIAARAGINPGAVRTRLTRIRDELFLLLSPTIRGGQS